MRVPISASALLKQLSPRKHTGNQFFSNNRFQHLRDNSPAPHNGNDKSRSRSQSQKRKNTDEVSYASVAGTGLAASVAICPPPAVEEATIAIAKVNSLCDKIASDISATTSDPAVISVFNDVCEALKLITKTQENLLSSVQGRGNPGNGGVNLVSLGALPKKARKDISNKDSPVLTGNSQPEAQDADPIKKRFVEAVKEAEKSTLIFNLNMGTVPIMNKDTMATKSTLALTTMAAAKEGKQSSTPSNEAVTALDDVLSLAEDMSFFGNSTKSYKNSRDEKSGSFCTIPVKYTFKNKDTRIRAEAVLRERCQVTCSTPYPVILRECIKQVVEHVKQNYKDNFVRVTVDTTNFGLRVARRAHKESGDSTWQVYNDLLPLPDDVCDVNTRKVPEGFRFVFPHMSPKKGESSQNSPRLSRRESFESSGKSPPPQSK